MQIAHHRVSVHVHHAGKPVEPCIGLGQRMGLCVLHHLQPVLDRAVRAVMAREGFCRLCRDPLPLRQPRERRDRGAQPQRRVPSPGDQLPGLGEKLDLADAAPAQLHVVARQGDRPAQPLMLPNGEAHVMCVLNGRKVEVASPDERPQRVQKPLPRRDIPGAGARLDIGRAFPRTAKRFVVALRRFHRDANGCDTAVGAQPQVGAENVALRGILAQRGGHGAGRAHKGGACFVKIIRLETGLIEQANQIDVGGIVQFPRPHLAHGKDDHPARVRDICLRHAGQFAAPNLVGDARPQSSGRGRIGKTAEGLRDLFEFPSAAKIRHRRHQRDPPLALSQSIGQPAAFLCRRLRDNRVDGTLRILGSFAEPIALLFEQSHEVGRGGGRTGDGAAHLWRKTIQQLMRVLRAVCVVDAGTAGHAGGERFLGHSASFEAPVPLRQRPCGRFGQRLSQP